MTRELAKTVLIDGVIHEAGTSVSDEVAKSILAGDVWAGPATDEEPEGTSYKSWKVPDLKVEIERRNADRGEDDLLSVDGKKDDLIAVLESDDADNE